MNNPWNNPLLILLLAKGVYSEACFIPLLKTEVSKMDYALKAKSSKQESQPTAPAAGTSTAVPVL
jgi:hypothetical protein